MAQDLVIRCLNCFERLQVEAGASKITCPNCKVEYALAWRGKQAKIAGQIVTEKETS